MNKRFLRYAARVTVVFLSLIAFYFLAAFILSRITVNGKPVPSNDVSIYIISNGIHTDIAVPATHMLKDWTKEIKYNHTVHADSTYNYLAFGWGDEKFYLETPEFSDLKLSTGLRAITGLSTSAMHTSYYHTPVEDQHCKKIIISNKQYQQLINYVTASFLTDAKGNFINIGSEIHYDDTDAFYKAKGSYSIFKTCNTWANSALKSCDQKACLWTIFDTPILNKYQ